MTTDAAHVMGDIHHALEGAARPDRRDLDVLVARARLALLTLQREEAELQSQLERMRNGDARMVPEISGHLRATRRELASLRALLDDLARRG